MMKLIFSPNYKYGTSILDSQNNLPKVTKILSIVDQFFFKWGWEIYSASVLSPEHKEQEVKSLQFYFSLSQLMPIRIMF